MSFDVEAIPQPEARLLPWNIPGSTDVSSATTVDEALSMGGLDWNVVQEPVYQKMPGDRKYRPAPNRVFNVRETDREILGLVTPSYNVQQNRDQLAFLQELIGDELALPDRVGELENGKLVYMTMRLPNTITVPGDPSPLNTYIFVSNAHDGWRTLTAKIQVIRLICTNGMTRDTTESMWKVKHTAYLSGKVKIARESLGITFNYLDEFKQLADVLVKRKLRESQVDDLLKQIFPVSENATESQIERSQFYGAKQVWEYSETIDSSIRGTAWGLLSAVTEFVDHASRYRSKQMGQEESRAESILFGQASWKKQRAYDVLTKVA